MEASFNVHRRDFYSIREDFTIEFNVKNPPNLHDLSETDLEFEYMTGHFTNHWAGECFLQIAKICRAKRWTLRDWSFAGRSNGWFALLCTGDSSAVTDLQIERIENIVESYFKQYGVKLAECYPQERE